MWEALLTIAAFAGGAWWERANAAALALTEEGKQGSQTLGSRLLTDLREVFREAYAEHEAAGVDEGRPFAVQTFELLTRLCADEASPWKEILPGDRRITATWLARQLKGYGVRPLDIKWEGSNRKGYYMADFEEAWARYTEPLDEDGEA